jgi:anion-transporting  ArsA/GET3 family ATPase
VVVTIDPARRLADALGLEGGLGAEPQRVAVDVGGHAAGDDADGVGELWAMMLDTGATFDGLVRRYADDPGQVRRILDNPFYRNIAGAMSGTQEYMAAETLYELHRDDRFDLVVVDTPPSRHTLDFLDAPGVLSRFLDHRLFKLLMLPTRGGLRVIGAAGQPILRAIGKVVGSDVLTDAVAFFQAFAGMETGFRERADAVVALLRADETAFVVVASPRRDTVAEAVWFDAQLADQGVGVAALIVNRMHPAFGVGSSAEARERAEQTEDPDEAALWHNAADLRADRERELDTLGPLLDGAGRATALVPLLDRDVHDVDGLWEIADYVFGAPPP